MIDGKFEIRSGLRRELFEKCIMSLQEQIIPSLIEMGINIPEYIEKLYKNADILVAYNEERVVGVAAVYTNDNENKHAYLSFIGVYDEYQRKGYGDALLKAVECKAKKHNMYVLKLEVFKQNKRAIEFYIHNNYVQIEETYNSYIMEKQIDIGS